MAVECSQGMLPESIIVTGQGIEFCVGRGDVEITFEFPDHDSTDEKTLTVPREDWEAVVAFIAAEHAARAGDEKYDAEVAASHANINAGRDFADEAWRSRRQGDTGKGPR